MKKYTTIPKGYRLTIDSWENDLDVRRTLTKNGLSIDQLKLDLDLCRLLYSDNQSMVGSGFGNESCVSNEFCEALRIVLKAHKDIVPNDIDLDEIVSGEQYEFPNFLHFASEIIDEYFGTSDNGDYNRVLESYKIEYVLEDILIEDVTLEFKKD